MRRFVVNTFRRLRFSTVGITYLATDSNVDLDQQVPMDREQHQNESFSNVNNGVIGETDIDNTIDFSKYIEQCWIKNDGTFFRCKSFQCLKKYQHTQLTVEFPEPNDININMMPFIMSDNFEKTKLPMYLKPYYDNLISKCYYCQKQENKIYFLTIHESFVKKGETQRRPGLHVDCAPQSITTYTYSDHDANINDITNTEHDSDIDISPLTKQACHNQGAGKWNSRHFIHPWGMGVYCLYDPATGIGTIVDGIFMANTVDDTCVAWKCRIIADENGNEVIGHLGDIEHLRYYLPNQQHKRFPNSTGKEMLKANQMYWMTDRTPHESLPMTKDGYRQFFRLVTEQVGIWYQDHSTPNPNGVVPDPQITKVVKGNKFVLPKKEKEP